MVAAESATQEQVSSVIALAQAYKQLGDVIEDMGRSPIERLQVDRMRDPLRSPLRNGASTRRSDGKLFQLYYQHPELGFYVIRRITARLLLDLKRQEMAPAAG